jgi:hypothetical protein
MEPEPAPVGPRNFLGLPKERDEQQEYEIRVDPGLELEVAGEIFRRDGALAFFELKRGMKRVVNFFHEGDERADVPIAQAGARIVPFELLDEPPGIINSDVKLVVGVTEKSPGQLAEFARVRPGQKRELRAPALVDQTIFKIDPDLRVGAFEQLLDLAEERFVHRTRSKM